MSGPFFEKKIIQNNSIFNFFRFFFNFWPYKHTKFRDKVKLNADSEFLVWKWNGPSFFGTKNELYKVKNVIFGQKMTKNRFFFQKMARTCGLKFNLIKLSCFKLKKNILENFWRIFQGLICDLVRGVKVVNFHKRPIWAQRPIFFQIFSSDSDSSSHFTLSLNWICKNMPRNKKFWINRPKLEIPITVTSDEKIIGKLI